jgi:hypothetical protein
MTPARTDSKSKRMQIEAFSEGKDPGDLAANEDQFLILPGRGYAVLDGVTDVNGQLYDGMRRGRLASGIVQRAAAEMLATLPPEEINAARLIEHANARLLAAYERFGLSQEVRTDPDRRFSTTLTLAIDLGAAFRFILIGDSGLRLNGSEVVANEMGLDLVTASLRQEAYALVEAAGGGPAERARVGKSCAFYGAANLHPDMRPWLDAGKLLILSRRSLERSVARFPAVPVEDIASVIAGGVVGQGRFRNRTGSPFSYSVLDGFEIPLELVTCFERPRASLRSIELFSDGYFRWGAEPRLAAWEAAFAEVERLDPEKIRLYPSVKGSYDGIRTDDRTVVIARL